MPNHVIIPSKPAPRSPAALGWAARVALATAVLACSAPHSDAQASLTRDQYVRFMDAALEKVDRQIKKSGSHNLLFSAQLFFAHGSAVKYFDIDTLTKYADGLKDAGARRIDINPGLSFNDNQDKYDRLVQYIRSIGLQVALNPEYNRGDRKYTRLADWEKDALPLYTELARRYQPDVFVLVHEPTTMTTRMGITASPAEWGSFVESTAAAVRKASPRTRLAAGGLAKEMDYFRTFVSMPVLDAVTINIYDLRDLQGNNQMIMMARGARKPAYILETWRQPYVGGPKGKTGTLESFISTGVGSKSFQTVDARWLETIAKYASGWGLEAFTPFWTQTFFLYGDGDVGALDYQYNSQVAKAIQGGQRTDTFRAYQALARQYGR
jgi:hypothetical protein